MLDALNTAGNRDPPHSDVIRLATINETVNSVNHQRMSLIETEPKVFRAVYSEGAEKAFGRALPAETDLADGGRKVRQIFLKLLTLRKRSSLQFYCSVWVSGMLVKQLLS